MAKETTIEPVDTLTIPEHNREDFIRVVKYGMVHSPGMPSDLGSLLNTWLIEEEAKIDRSEGRFPAESEEDPDWGEKIAEEAIQSVGGIE